MYNLLFSAGAIGLLFLNFNPATAETVNLNLINTIDEVSESDDRTAISLTNAIESRGSSGSSGDGGGGPGGGSGGGKPGGGEMFQPSSNFGDPSSPPPSSTEYAIGGDTLNFQRDKPTVAFVHGRQPSFGGQYLYTGNPFDVEQLEGAYNNIKANYPDFNVLLVTWEAAFVFRASLSSGGLLSPIGDIYDVGNSISDSLFQTIGGTDYDQQIHFVGHSYGSALNNTIAPNLQRLGADVSQITVLDAPTNVLFGPYDVLRPEQYQLAATVAQVERFENYYGDLLDAYGEAISGAEINGGYFLDLEHTEIFDTYVESIRDPSALEMGGFNRPLLVENQVLKSIVFDFVVEDIDFIDPFFANVLFEPSGGLLYEGSDAYWGGTIGNLSNYGALGFSISDMDLGPEDWFEVLLDGRTLAYFDPGSKINDLDLFLTWDQDQVTDGILSFLLSGRGLVDSSLKVTDLKVYTYQTEIAPVPLPASLSLFLVGLTGLGLVARRRRNNHI
ncbi:hypothetical protein [Ruegeria arenilitoris]|uniref:hypothetical protein n=1 Tax=Ruegeria arenilitoris TaxID=1173585 RepID=UPI00147DB7A8|nr:hypothetical protein [Ruegeria arenilitoris]